MRKKKKNVEAPETSEEQPKKRGRGRPRKDDSQKAKAKTEKKAEKKGKGKGKKASNGDSTKSPDGGVQLVVVSKMKAFATDQGVRVGGDFIPAVNKALVKMIKSSVKRCQANGRATLQDIDV